MQIAIIGAGAMGATLAVTLARAGEEITLCVAPERVPEGGALRVTIAGDEAEMPQWAIVPVLAALPEVCDLAVLAVRSPDLAVAAQTIAATNRMAPIALISSVPGAEGRLDRLFPDGVVVGLVPEFVAELRTPGYAYRSGTVAFAVAQNSDPRILAMLQRAVTVRQVPDLDGLRWTRLILSTPALLSLLAATSLPSLLEQRRLESAASALLREATQVVEAAQLPLAPLPGLDLPRLRRLHTLPGIFVGRAVRPFLEAAAQVPLPGSLAQSLQHHRTTEIDDLYGTLVALGGKYHIPTPILSQVIALCHQVEQTGNWLTPATLERALR